MNQHTHLISDDGHIPDFGGPTGDDFAPIYQQRPYYDNGNKAKRRANQKAERKAKTAAIWSASSNIANKLAESRADNEINISLNHYSHFRLLELPREIRDQIWRACLVRDGIMVCPDVARGEDDQRRAFHRFIEEVGPMFKEAHEKRELKWGPIDTVKFIFNEDGSIEKTYQEPLKQFFQEPHRMEVQASYVIRLPDTKTQANSEQSSPTEITYSSISTPSDSESEIRIGRLAVQSLHGAILTTCKQIYAETIGILYGGNTFHFDAARCEETDLITEFPPMKIPGTQRWTHATIYEAEQMFERGYQPSWLRLDPISAFLMQIGPENAAAIRKVKYNGVYNIISGFNGLGRALPDYIRQHALVMSQALPGLKTLKLDGYMISERSIKRRQAEGELQSIRKSEETARGRVEHMMKTFTREMPWITTLELHRLPKLCQTEEFEMKAKQLRL